MLILLVKALLAPVRRPARSRRRTRPVGRRAWRVVRGEDPSLTCSLRFELNGGYTDAREIWTKERGFKWDRRSAGSGGAGGAAVGVSVGREALARMFPDGLTAACRNQPGELWWLN